MTLKIASVTTLASMIADGTLDVVPDDMFEHLCRLFNYTPKGLPLTTKEAAKVLARSPNRLEQDRLQHIGPRFYQPGGPGTRVYYSERDLLAYLARGGCTNTMEQPRLESA